MTRKKIKAFVDLYLDELLDFVVEQNGKLLADETVSQYRKALSSFFGYIVENNINQKRFFTRKSFVGWCHWATETKGYGASTYKQYSSYISIFMRMLFIQSKAEQFDLKLPVVRIEAEKIRPKHSIIPVYRDILHVRRQRMSIDNAIAFEIMCSSGLRSSECFQLRWCDISPNPDIYDMEEKCSSKYVGLKIKLDVKKHQIKDKKNRLTYASLQALKLVNIAKSIRGVDWDSRMPLITTNKDTMKRQLEEIRSEYVFGSERSIQETESSNFNAEREIELIKESMQKVKDSASLPRQTKINMLKKMRKNVEAILKRKQAEDLKLLNSRERSHTGRFTLHGLRHFAAGLLYFRSWEGVYSDVMRAKQYLGHASETMTLNYLDELNVVDSKQEWVRIMKGGSLDYSPKNLLLRRVRRNK